MQIVGISVNNRDPLMFGIPQSLNHALLDTAQLFVRQKFPARKGYHQMIGFICRTALILILNRQSLLNCPPQIR